MALVPTFITRQSLVLNTKGKKSLVSTSFFAKFADGSEKILNRKEWIFTSLLRDCDFDLIGMDKDKCCLYYCDWGKNPILGEWDKNYPINLIPKEIFN